MKTKEKVCLTKRKKIMITLFIGLLFYPEYSLLCYLGTQILKNNIIQMIVIFGWFWLLCGKWLFLSMLWDEE